MADDPSSEWRQWLNAHGPRLFLFARQQTRCEEDARDVLQDALVEIWKRSAGGVPAIAQVFVAVRRRAVDQARGNQRRLAREGAWLLETANEAWFCGPPQEGEAVAAALQHIRKDFAEVVVLKVWGELTFEEIGATLGINPSTAASRYRYGLRELRDHLELREGFVRREPR